MFSLTLHRVYLLLRCTVYLVDITKIPMSGENTGYCVQMSKNIFPKWHITKEMLMKPLKTKKKYCWTNNCRSPFVLPVDRSNIVMTVVHGVLGDISKLGKNTVVGNGSHLLKITIGNATPRVIKQSA